MINKEQTIDLSEFIGTYNLKEAKKVIKKIKSKLNKSIKQSNKSKNK